MTLIPQLIAPFQTGLDTDIQTWLAPPDSFTLIDNIHVRHGYLEKRSGFRTFGQMVTTETAININNITQANPGEVTTASAHGYSNGDLVYIAGVTGMTEVNDSIFTVTVTGANTFTIGVDTTTFGAYGGGGTVARSADDTDRVMGIFRYIQSDNSKETLVFNTTRANKYDGVTDTFQVLDSGPIMSGSNTDYVWATNWQSSNLDNRLYFSNGKAFDGASLDGIRYYDASGTGNTTTSFRPTLNSGGNRILWGAKLIFVIKQRLLVLNTYERDTGSATTTNFPQRARWCQAQGPSNWDDITPGGGGFVDAPTGDQIISAQSLQDSIIVFFTNSVWTLRPVSDPALPFRWDKINDFRACDGKMATIGYDRDIKSLGVRGITATNGVETQRIDGRIEDFTFDEINTNDFQKVFCQRSYAERRWWTLYPTGDSSENNAVLIFSEETGAFTTYSLNMNCLGFGNFEEDFGLNDFVAANDLDLSLNEMSEETLQSFYWQDQQETLLGGNISGTIYVLETETTDDGSDISATFFSAGWNPFQSEGKEALFSYIDFFVDTDETTTATIEFFKDNDQSPYTVQTIDFLPNLNFIASIINADTTNPVSINAPSHGLSTNDFVSIYQVQGMTELNGGPFQITVVDDNNFTLNDIDGSAFTPYTTGGQIYERPFYKTKTWKRAYSGGIGYLHRIRFTSSGSNFPFRIHAFKPVFKARGRRTIN